MKMMMNAARFPPPPPPAYIRKVRGTSTSRNPAPNKDDNSGGSHPAEEWFSSDARRLVATWQVMDGCCWVKPIVSLYTAVAVFTGRFFSLSVLSALFERGGRKPPPVEQWAVREPSLPPHPHPLPPPPLARLLSRAHDCSGGKGSSLGRFRRGWRWWRRSVGGVAAGERGVAGTGALHGPGAPGGGDVGRGAGGSSAVAHRKNRAGKGDHLCLGNRDGGEG